MAPTKGICSLVQHIAHRIIGLAALERDIAECDQRLGIHAILGIERLLLGGLRGVELPTPQIGLPQPMIQQIELGFISCSSIRALCGSGRVQYSPFSSSTMPILRAGRCRSAPATSAALYCGRLRALF